MQPPRDFQSFFGRELGTPGCAQGLLMVLWSFLAVLNGTYMVPWIQVGLAMYKASALMSELSLRAFDHFFEIKQSSPDFEVTKEQEKNLIPSHNFPS